MVMTFRSKTPQVDLNTHPIQQGALQLVPESIARKYIVIPLVVADGALKVAMADPGDISTIQVLEARARMRVEPMLASSADIRSCIDRNYKKYAEIEQQFEPVESGAAAVREQEKSLAEAVAEAPAVRALDMLISEAVKHRASDIHIEPQEDALRVRYRIDGVLQDTVSLPLSAHGPLISRIKILASMNIADHRPQDGQFSLIVQNREVNIRVVTIQSMYGQMSVLRILDKSFGALELPETGMLPGPLGKYQSMLRSPFGMILLSGPTGSGKTTTLYASVNGMDHKTRNVITVEDPVEYRLRGINQIEVNPKGGVTFATGLRTILRLDPDVILVGEIRDGETAEIATQAALTGHLVLSSVHANDTVGSLFRLLDLGVGAFYLSSAVVGVVAQRMVRKVCPHCRHFTQAPAEAQLAYNKELGEDRTEFSYGKGCPACAGTGFLGRTAVFEILAVSEEIRRLLLTGASAAQIRARAREEGMVSMWRDGMLKAKTGITTPCEVVRNVYCIE
ncbi:MAG: type II/IV secretion system protein [Chloroflexi bacterium]|nr:type II/IV secretion system protein [Chloroflexota bacterium]